MNITTKLDHISSDFITQYLTALGITDVKHYLKPTKKCFENLWNYPNMKKACEILKWYVDNKASIGIIIDSDCDGSCSSALMYQFLKSLGINDIHTYFHEGKQHGIKDKLDEIIAINGTNSLLIVPDAGTNDVKECQVLGENTIEVIITDHHNIDKDNIFATIINNQHEQVNNHALSGAGVTDKFVRAYCELYDIKYPNYNDLVAVSLAADICDLSTIENRTYLYYGLHNITNPFLAYLFEKCCKRRGYTPEAIGWDISPLSNALARSDIQESKTLFFDGLIGKIMPEEALKQMRKIKRLQDEKIKAVVEEIEPNLDFSTKVIVGYTQPENASFTGLIANKFTGKYNKPTILLRDTNFGSWSGSLRSPVPLATKINNSGIANAQGHEEACGVIIKKNKMVDFIEWLETLDLSNHPDIPVTAIAAPKDITLKLCGQIEKHKDLWGEGIENPQFYIKTQIDRSNVFVFEKSTTTIKLDINGVSFLKFFASEKDVKDFTQYDNFEIEMVVGSLSVNEWEGNKTPQCIIQEYEIKEVQTNNAEEDWLENF